MSFKAKNIAIVDCNNFYVSCERLFRPDLRDKPVAVLSNNDGCIVSRSQEVKDLGIKMAVPVHQVKNLIEQHKIELFSSNYPLYADLSERIMQSLADFSPSLEVYSIDEAFLALESSKPTETGFEIKKRIWQWVGIPVGVGIGQTKTLAKLANYIAKKWPQTGGVFDINDELKRKKVMQITPVNEVWGVGQRLSERLKGFGIETVWDLQSQSADSIKKNFNITLAKTVQELQGVPAISLVPPEAPKQQIICSRSFKTKLTKQAELAQSLSVFCLRAAEKLRKQKGFTRRVRVSIRTSPFNPEQYCYSNSADQILSSATNDSRYLLKVMKQLLQQIYKPGFSYQKAGITLADIVNPGLQSAQQQDLFSKAPLQADNALMATLDEINQRFGNCVGFAATGDKKIAQSIPLNQSNRYTTQWQEIAQVM